jgi:hypothetical protein
MAADIDIHIQDAALTVNFEFKGGPLPLSLRPYDEDLIEEDPRLRGQVEPEDAHHCTDVLDHMLSGENIYWLPKCCRLLGVREVDISPYAFFERPDRPDHTIAGSVTFDVGSTVFEGAHGKGHFGEVRAKHALRDIIEKYQSLCSVPGQLSWATNWMLHQDRMAAAASISWGMEESLARQNAIRAKYVELPPPDFVGNLCLPHAMYRLDMLLTEKPRGTRYGTNWRYPKSFVELVTRSSDPLYLNDGGYSRIYFFVNDNDQVTLALGTESLSGVRDRWEQQSAAIQLRAEIEQAATAAYKEMEDAPEA